MKKALMIVAACGSCSLFAMDPDDTSLVLRSSSNVFAIPSRTETFLEQHHCSVNEEGLKKMVKEGQLKVTKRTTKCHLGPWDSHVEVTVDNCVENSQHHYLEEYLLPILKEGTPLNYEVDDINVAEKKAILWPIWPIVVGNIDDDLNNKLGVADKMADGRFVLKSEFGYKTYVDRSNPVTISNLDDDFCSQYNELTVKWQADFENRNWQLYIEHCREQKSLAKTLIPIAIQRALGKKPQQEAEPASNNTSIVKVESESCESDFGTSESRYSEAHFEYHGYQRREKLENCTRPQETVFCEATEDWETVAKPKPAAPIVPTRIMLLEAMGLQLEDIVHYIYKISWDRMRNEFRWLVAPLLRRTDNRFVLILLSSCKIKNAL